MTRKTSRGVRGKEKGVPIFPNEDGNLVHNVRGEKRKREAFPPP